MKIKIAASLLSAALLIGTMAGCQSSELKTFEEQEPQESAEAQNTEVTDFDAAYKSFKPDEVMFTADGKDVTWDQVFYWMYYDVSGMENYIGPIENWDDPCLLDQTKSNAEFVKGNAKNVMAHYTGLEKKAEELGLGITEEDEKIMQEDWDANIKNYGNGSEEEFLKYLESAYMNKDLYNYINKINILYGKVMKETCGENGEKLGEDEILSAANDQGYVHVKHILFSTVDDTRQPLPDEQKQAKKAEAEKTLAQLKAITDNETLVSTFDQIMVEKSGDPGKELMPEGYVYLPGTMVPEFEAAAKELDEYGVSEIVESVHGYHIILRLPLKTTDIVENRGEGNVLTLAQVIAPNIFNQMTSQWAEEIEIKENKVFKNMDLSKVFVSKK